jgi:hypothetical protein
VLSDLPVYSQTETEWNSSYFSFSTAEVNPNLSRSTSSHHGKNIPITLGKSVSPVALRVNSAKSDLYTAASQKREIGNQLHDILSQLPDMEAWPYVKAKSKLDLSTLESLFESEKVRSYFAKDALAFKEVDLLCPDGKVIRPDRVNKVGGALQVIDFKTGKEKPEHQDQINRYKQALVDMGYQVTKGVLIYVESRELVDV